ncbi:hypothetical protein GUJ93_ZPchr0011g28040 [Zizania palustris]|uniref:BZIP domain-containing protein n=1 Tax=Zizania palustris TaxID=103762 RepID=A0A8J6BPN4_ZIZPA|nr:hypothetical protein GUJ93_ZPchr0011g28040 [Zizania palustris]
MSRHSSSDGHWQCRRGVTVDVELDAAMALADMAGAGPGEPPASAEHPSHRFAQAASASSVANDEHDDDELASTRLSLELGKVGIQSSPPCSSNSTAGHPALQVAAAASGFGPRPRHMLTEADKEAKRLRRVLANRESARQTILRRQAIRDELARKVADLSSQNETIKKEKDVVLQEYLSLKETNKQLKQQVATRTTKKASAAVTTAMEPMETALPGQQAEAVPTTATSPQPSFLYNAAAPPAVQVPYVWGSWPPCGSGYEHGGNPAGASAAPPLCLPPCAWYYSVVADPQSTTYPQPFQDKPRPAEQTSSPGGRTAEEDTDDDPCSLTLAIDVDKRGTSSRAPGAAGPGQQHAFLSDREKAATAAEARKRRKELTKLKQMHGGCRPGGGDHW